ncbi:hypothetical protein [Deinococcus aestuarii]|uniref:hypothetical protein n=1 Tax=Deinococcus aestuarii TaxID=2774531 RepID=UPI001FE93E97|nr:hypothetical protein [Deinococcus aestuarii]
MKKPAGLTVIPPGEVDALLAALPVEEFYGVGPVIAGKLQAQGIHTGAELRARSLAELQAILGAGKRVLPPSARKRPLSAGPLLLLRSGGG